MSLPGMDDGDKLAEEVKTWVNILANGVADVIRVRALLLGSAQEKRFIMGDHTIITSAAGSAIMGFWHLQKGKVRLEINQPVCYHLYCL